MRTQAERNTDGLGGLRTAALALVAAVAGWAALVAWVMGVGR